MRAGISVGTDANDTFINVGRDYPDDDRFTIVLWDVGKTRLKKHEGDDVCATGEVTSYQGVPEMEFRSDDELRFGSPGTL